MENPDKINTESRYIIKAKTPTYYAEIKRLYNSGISRKQLHKILEITKGNIAGLRVAKHVGVPRIWFTYGGHRYDLKADGTVVAETKLGFARNPVSQRSAKEVTCQLCGKKVPLSQFELKAKCPVCGFQLVRYSVVRRA